VSHFRIVEWNQYQHYKDRCPPWVKLHKSLITSRTWVCMDDASRVLAIACMVLAADTDNQIPDDPEYLKRVAYLNSTPIFDPLVKIGFLEFVEEKAKTLAAASNVLAICTTEERRGETDGASAKRKHTIPNGWWPKDKTSQDLMTQFSLNADDLSKYVIAFQDACKAKGYKYSDFDAAFRNCVRQDWPKLRAGKQPQGFVV
jgi:hypothetical protein